LLRLERIVHPLVVTAELEFLRAAEQKGAPLAVLEIPLLFETGADSRVDVTVVMSAPHDMQRARVLSRPGMTADKLEHLLARQLPDAERRARADYVVDSGLSLADMRIEIDKLIESLKNRDGRVMDRLRRKD
jgi:dephospho-CoA kinase